jgi:hypothetical protein
MKVDMSPEAITRRLRQTSELRRLCLALAGERYKAIAAKNKPRPQPQTENDQQKLK